MLHMRIKRTLKNLFGRRARDSDDTRGIGGAIARKTSDPYFGSYFTPIIARAGVTTSYAELSEEILNSLPPNKVRDIIKSSNPIVAKALADYADAMSSGFTWTADKVDPDTVGSPAHRLIEEFLSRLESNQGGLAKLIEEMSRGMFAHGASFTELVIDKDGRTPRRLKVLDPTTAVFRQKDDPIDGQGYELGQDMGLYDSLRSSRRPRSRVVQRQFGGPGYLNFVSLDGDPTIQYRPIQSEPNYPYGIPILDPAVFHVIMAAGFLSSFRTALTGHVYPNLLVTIDKEKFKEFSGNKSSVKGLQQKLNDTIRDIKSALGNLKPGGAIVQGDEVSIGGSLSGTGRSPLGSMKEIQDVIRRDLIVAVQSQPILMGSNEAVAETHAVVQIKAYGKLIRRSQRSLNAMFTEYFNLILELNGYPPLAEFKLNYENSAEYKDQAQTFLDFRQGLLTASQDLTAFVEALDTAKASGYITDAEAQAVWDEGMEIRRQLNILPKEL